MVDFFPLEVSDVLCLSVCPSVSICVCVWGGGGGGGGGGVYLFALLHFMGALEI